MIGALQWTAAARRMAILSSFVIHYQGLVIADPRLGEIRTQLG